MSYVRDEVWLQTMLDSLTAQHEMHQALPWSTSDAPEGYIQKMFPAIVGIEIEIISITGQWKLSQNQPENNKLGVIAALSAQQENQYQKIAELVKLQMPPI